MKVDLKQVYMKLHLIFGVSTIYLQSSTQPIKNDFVYVYIVDVIVDVKPYLLSEQHN